MGLAWFANPLLNTHLNAMTLKMKAAFLKASWMTALRDLELPEPPAQWVRVKIEACGICGTDATAIQKATEWQPFGHEIAGVVEAAGAGVTHLAPGTRVVLESSSACGVCHRCRNGRPAECIGHAPNFWGQPSLGCATHMNAPAICCVPYEGVDPVLAALAEPAGVALDMVHTADIAPGDSVCIVGPGPIALMALAIAKHRGATRLACIGRAGNSARFDIARELGAEVCDIANTTGLENSFDHLLVTAPPATIPPLLPLLTFGGRATYIGIGTGDATLTFDANDFHLRKLQLRASYAAPAMYFPAALGFLKSNAIPGERLVSHRFPLAKIQDAMNTLRDPKSGAVKVVITNP